MQRNVLPPHRRRPQDASDCEDCCCSLCFGLACSEKADHDALVGEGPSDASALRSWRRLKSATRCESARRATLGSGSIGGRSESSRDNGLRGGFGSEERCGVTISRTSSAPNGANEFLELRFSARSYCYDFKIERSEHLGKRRLSSRLSRPRRSTNAQTGAAHCSPFALLWIEVKGRRTGGRVFIAWTTCTRSSARSAPRPLGFVAHPDSTKGP